MNWRCCLLLLLSVPLGAQPAPGPAAAADDVRRQLQSVSWGAAYAEWQRAHGRASCQQSPGEDPAPNLDGLWCYRCTEQSQSYTAEWFFYAVTPDDPPVARLERFRAFVGGSAAEPIRVELRRGLSALYGTGEDAGQPSEINSAFWRGARRWRRQDLEIYLYRAESPAGGSRVEIMARHGPLIGALAESRRLEEEVEPRWRKVATLLDLDLAEELPNVSGLLSKEDPAPSTGELVAALLPLLEQAKSAPTERRPVLLLAADRLANRIEINQQESPEWDRQREQLARYGLTYAWGELGGAWVYSHDLLQRVWESYGSTAWGEQAFLQLEADGWNTGVGCGSGTDTFRTVIARGEQFLAQRPKSPYRLEVLFALAQAYETKWSLSQAREGDDYVDRRLYQEGAGAARVKAIQYYQQVLPLAPAGNQTASARLQLPRLKLGIDTVQRRYFCIYD